MKKFVVSITHGSEFEGTWTEHVPVEYDSIEALYVDLNKMILDGKNAKLDYRANWVVLAGKKFHLDWFEHDDPEPVREHDIMLLDDWFNSEHRA